MTAAIPGLAIIAIWAAIEITAARRRDRAAIKAANQLIDQVTAELAHFAAWEEEVEEQWH